jgi:glycosyltransferase involved in cell wall biosynthesis
MEDSRITADLNTKERSIRDAEAAQCGRLLIFIVAYNAERTIEEVLKRIPVNLAERYDVEVLIIDDSSHDDTFNRSEVARRKGIVPFKLTVLFNPVNQGYGGNQKIGFHYAVENGFDWVALVHGDGQYAPECLPELVAVLADNEAEAVFGSRMLEKGGALQGGMPLYKYVGNKILTGFQNGLLGTSLSEFHSGYRLYSTKALAAVPFELNSNDFHFDTEIIIQFVIAGHRIKEIAIPTFYGDEVCHVNGLQYAWNVCWATLHARVQRYHIFYDRKFDCVEEPPVQSSSALSYLDREILNRVQNGARILVLGEIDAALYQGFENSGCQVVVYAQDLSTYHLPDVKDFHYLLLADVSIAGYQPEELIHHLRRLCVQSPDIVILLHVGNIAFGLTRILLLLGRFAYSKKGIINLQQHRLFTRRSLKKLFSQNGFRIVDLVGLPVPYERIFTSKKIVQAANAVHGLLNCLWASFFGYQFLLVTRPLPSLHYLLSRAEQMADERKKNIL